MKLTRSAGYALVAVGNIARAPKNQPVLAKSIAKQYKIPLDYLLKILQQLVRAHILSSIRGPRGGFMLARTATRISVLEVIEAVDGPFVTQPVLSKSKSDAAYTQRLASTYQKASKDAAQILSKATIAQLIPGLKPVAGSRKTRKRARR